MAREDALKSRGKKTMMKVGRRESTAKKKKNES